MESICERQFWPQIPHLIYFSKFVSFSPRFVAYRLKSLVLVPPDHNIIFFMPCSKHWLPPENQALWSAQLKVILQTDFPPWTDGLYSPSRVNRVTSYRAFALLAVETWNELPLQVGQHPPFTVFKTRLKTHFSPLAFNACVLMFHPLNETVIFTFFNSFCVVPCICFIIL